MSSFKELIADRIKSTCELSYSRFHFTYQSAICTMLVEVIELHARKPAPEVVEAVFDALQQLQDETDRCDSLRHLVLRFAGERLPAAAASLPVE